MSGNTNISIKEELNPYPGKVTDGEWKKMVIEREERRKKREKNMEIRNEEEIKYLSKFFPSIMEDKLVIGTILRLNALDEENEYDYDSDSYDPIKAGVSDYENITGMYIFDEQTLILGDKDDNVYAVFEQIILEKGKGNIIDNITKNIHVMDVYRYDDESNIYKKHKPAKIPDHLRPLIIINKSTNITNISGSIINIKDKIVPKFNTFTILGCDSVENFLERNYKRGGMCSFKEMKHHPEWKNEYKNIIETKKVNICKSCEKKSMKGCCKYYHSTNRKILVMTIGWHKPDSIIRRQQQIRSI